MVHVVKTIDAHTAGEPLRLIVDGVPQPVGRTMLGKRDWMRRHADHLRRAVMLEPRGHADMYGAMLTEPVSPGSHAGVLFMHNEGYSTMCGHGVIAVTTIAIERGLFVARETELERGLGSAPPAGREPGSPTRVPQRDGVEELVFDSPAGVIHARARVLQQGDRRRVDTVAFTNVPSFVYAAGQTVKLGVRELRVDIAFGGAFYAIADTEAIGIPLEPGRVPELRRIATDIKTALEASSFTIQHPLEPSLRGVYGVIFTAPPHDVEAHLRNLTVFADAEVDRSPCGTGTAAVMAVLDAMGLLTESSWFVHESVIGTLLRGRVLRRTRVGELPAIVAEIQGSAWVTGEHTFLIDDEDPLRDGFKL